MDYKEACHRLRITPTLLKWFTSYSPKHDGRKLQQQSMGNFDMAELEAFDAHLSNAWPSRDVPAGIDAELFVEACGHCALCGDPCEKLQMAHISRKDIEVGYYFQHPGNLIPLCGTCHDRYDDRHMKAVSHQVILAAKERLVSRKMESIDRDVERAKAVREAVDGVKAELVEKLSLLTGAVPTNQVLWTAGAADLLTAATQSVFGGPHVMPGGDLTSPSKFLTTLSDSVGTAGNVTQAVLDGYAEEATGRTAEAPSEWEMIEYEDDRTICDLCDPGEDRPPALVNYAPHDEGLPGSSAVDFGRCDWCSGISIRCRDCGVVRSVSEGEYETVLECEGGCGLRFTVKSDYDPGDGGGGEYVEIVHDDDDDDDNDDGDTSYDNDDDGTDDA